MGEGDEYKDAHPRFGIRAERSCTDAYCIVLFIVFWVLMVFVASVAFENGDPNRVFYGTDAFGNNCGQGTPNASNIPASSAARLANSTTVATWGQMKNIWYPLQFDPVRQQFSFERTLQMGYCVAECPQISSPLFVGYTAPGKPASSAVIALVLYNSMPVLNRCVPNMTSFICPPNQAGCAGILANGVQGSGSFGELAQRSIDELQAGWWVIVVCAVIAVLLSFAWLFILRRTVKPLVVVTCMIVLVALILGGVLCWVMRGQTLDDANADPETQKYWLAGAVTFWVVSFLYLCILMFLFRDVMTACDIIEEASKVPIKIPTMTLVPLVCFIICLPLMMWTLSVAVLVETSGDTVSVNVPNFTLAGANSSFDAVGATYALEGWRIYAHLYNLFVFLWSFGVVNAVCFLIISMCAVFWYFSEPGDHKSPPLGSVMIATCKVLRYHLGTLCVGAFIVALVQIIRVILLIVEKRMSEALKKNETVKGILMCIHCLLACLERAMKFINKNAYIVTAIEGSSFWASAQRALGLLVTNALTVGAITVISEYVMIFGKVLITAVSTLIGFGILKGLKGDEAITSGVLIMACIALFSFFIATLFVNIFSVCIDTILLCYCVDKESSDGKHYFPADLESHVARNDKKAKPAGEKDEPLLQIHPPRVEL